MKNNTYFIEMEKTLRASWKERDELKRIKDDAKAKYGWGSPEYKEAVNALESFSSPYSYGSIKAFRAWETGVEKEDQEFVLTDFFWDGEIHDFLETLKAAGIKEFVFTNQSTGLMDDLHGLQAEGATIKELCVVYRKSIWGEPEELKGIRISLS